MGAGPIPRSAIKAYANEYAITGDEYAVFHSIIREMDSKWMSLINNRKSKPDDGLTAPANDPERTKLVMEVIKSRAAAANKRQTKQKKMH